MVVKKGVELGTKQIVDLIAKLSAKQKKQVAKSLGIRSGVVQSATGAGIATVGEKLVEGGVNAAAKSMSELQTALAAVEQSMGVDIPGSIGELGGQILKLRISLDDLSKDVGRATGLFTKLGGQLEEVAQRNRDLGVTFERTSKAMIGLDQGFSMLARSTKQQRQETLRFTFALENLGVAAEDSGRGLEVFARGTAMSQEAARKSTERLIQLSRQIAYKGGPAQMMRDIAEIGPMIAKFGANSEQVMSDLAKEARKTGLDMRQIFDVSDQFDTFEGALETAGKLNAQFGLGLSSTALLRADEAERRQIIVDSFQAQYGSFEGLGDRRQKQFMAEALGFGKNVQDARKYLEGEPITTDQVDSLESAAKAQTKVSEMGAAAQEKALTAMGDVNLPFNLGKLNNTADMLAGTFTSLNASVQYFNEMSALRVGGDLASAIFPGAENIIGGLQAMGEMGVLARATRVAAGEKAGTIPTSGPAPGTPMGQTAPGNMSYDDMALYGAGATVVGTGAYGVGRRVMSNRAAAKAAETAAKNIPRATGLPGFSRTPGLTPKQIAELKFQKLTGKPSSAPSPGSFFDDFIKPVAKGADDAAIGATSSASKGLLKNVGRVVGPALAFGFAEAEAREAAKAEGTTVGAQRGKQYAGAFGSIAAGAAMAGVMGGPAAPVTALVGGIAAAFLGERAVEAAYDYVFGDDKDKKKREAAKVRSKNQSADQALKKQQDSERQVVASAGMAEAGSPFSTTTNVYLGEELIHSSTQTPDNMMSQNPRRLKKVPRGQVSSNTVIG